MLFSVNHDFFAFPVCLFGRLDFLKHVVKGEVFCWSCDVSCSFLSGPELGVYWEASSSAYCAFPKGKLFYENIKGGRKMDSSHS